MNSIPMSIEGLKEQYEQYRIIEDKRRADLNALRRIVARDSATRLYAYRAWQKALKERKEAKAK